MAGVTGTRTRDTPAAQTWRVHETLAPITERYSLIGWSLGGQVALDLAAAMPGAIENLVLVNASPRFLAAPGWPYGTAAGMLRRLEAAWPTTAAGPSRTSWPCRCAACRRAPPRAC